MGKPSRLRMENVEPKHLFEATNQSPYNAAFNGLEMVAKWARMNGTRWHSGPTTAAQHHRDLCLWAKSHTTCPEFAWRPSPWPRSLIKIEETKLPSDVSTSVHMYMYIYIYIQLNIYGKCLGFARTRNDDGRRIIIIIIIIIIVIIITIIKPLLTIFKKYRILTGGGRIKPLLQIFNKCRRLRRVGELNPYRRSSMNVEV